MFFRKTQGWKVNPPHLPKKMVTGKAESPCHLAGKKNPTFDRKI